MFNLTGEVKIVPDSYYYHYWPECIEKILHILALIKHGVKIVFHFSVTQFAVLCMHVVSMFVVLHLM